MCPAGREQAQAPAASLHSAHELRKRPQTREPRADPCHLQTRTGEPYRRDQARQMAEKVVRRGRDCAKQLPGGGRVRP